MNSVKILFLLVTFCSAEFVFSQHAIYSRYNHKSNLIYYDSLIRNGDSSASTFKERGVSYFNLQKYISASKDLSFALQIDSTDWEAMELKGACLYYLKNEIDGITIMEKANHMDSSLSYLFLLKGNERFEKMHFAEAEEFYSKALVRDSDYFAALYNRAICYKELKRFEEAMIDVKHAMELDPNNLDIAIVKNEIEANKKYSKLTGMLFPILAAFLVVLGIGIFLIIRKRNNEEYFGEDYYRVPFSLLT